jgi:hypothetical protein
MRVLAQLVGATSSWRRVAVQHGAMLCSFCLLACGDRAASGIDATVTGEASSLADVARVRADGAMADPARADGPGVFCSGAARASVNGTELAVKNVEPRLFVPQCCREAAEVMVTAVSAAGQEWELHVELKVGLSSTIMDKPLPNTVQLASPPPGFVASVFVPEPIDGLLSSEHQKFSGTMTLTGQDYAKPLQLQLCLAADDAGQHHFPVHSVQIYVPTVTIPKWLVYTW